MTQEEKARRYDEALERARKIHNDTEFDYEKGMMEEVFPELSESEDERIEKALLEGFKNYSISFYNFGGVDVNSIIAWLEKQGKVDMVSYEVAENEKRDFVSGSFIECRKSFDEFKEDNSYWFEYVGNDTYIGRSDNILNKKFHITPRQLYSLFTQQHCPKENNVNEETNAPTAYGKYVDKHLNEAAKHFFSEGEDKYSVADLFYAGVRCGKSWFEKKGEKKSADKVEPKFNIGDWITDGHCTCQITFVDSRYWYSETCVLGNTKDIDKTFHLWTVADAKTGNVLACDGKYGQAIGIVKKYIGKYGGCDKCFETYCFVDWEGIFRVGEYMGSRNIHPATKEQREALLSMMKEKGYEWDVEKKELKKIVDETCLEKQGGQEQLYIRFGEIPTDEKSKIYQGDIEVSTENGVSVYPAFETNGGDIVLGLNLPITKTTLYTQQHLLEYDDRPCYLVKGNYVGKDTDGQPLINNVSIVKKIDSYRVKEEKVDNKNR